MENKSHSGGSDNKELPSPADKANTVDVPLSISSDAETEKSEQIAEVVQQIHQLDSSSRDSKENLDMNVKTPSIRELPVIRTIRYYFRVYRLQRLRQEQMKTAGYKFHNEHVQEPLPEDKRSFEENQHDFTRLHSTELPSLPKSPATIGVVTRAYKELSNGNISRQLLSLASQSIDGSAYETYIVVNNPRIYGLLAEVDNSSPAILRNVPLFLHHQVLSEAKRRGWDLSEWEQKFLKRLKHGKENVENDCKAYAENQLSLKLLRIVTQTSSNLLNRDGEQTEESLIIPALASIRQEASAILKTSQVELLETAVKAIFRKRTLVIGLDCSSPDKGFRAIDLGQASNQGGHIALARGVSFIDFSDMDQFRPKNGLTEILQSADKGYDILYRPMNTVTPQHPENMKKDRTFHGRLVNFYRTANQFAREEDMSYLRKITSSGKIIVSADTFRRHQYPHGHITEDFHFSRNANSDINVRTHYLLDTVLDRSYRGREESYDGSSLGRSEGTGDEVTELLEGYLRANRAFLETANSVTFDDEQLQGLEALYRTKRHEFFLDEQSRRDRMRLEILGIKSDGSRTSSGLLEKVLPVLKRYPRASVEKVIESAGLRKQQASFLIENPLLLTALTQFLSKRSDLRVQDTNEGQVIQLLESALPELFALPLVAEPEYTDLPQEANFTDYFHLFRAEQWMQAYLYNFLSDIAVSSHDEYEIRRLIDVSY